MSLPHNQLTSPQTAIKIQFDVTNQYLNTYKLGKNYSRRREYILYYTYIILYILYIGLNNRIDILGIHDAHEHVKSGNAVPIYKTFNTVKNNRTCRGLGENKQNNTNSLVNLEGVSSIIPNPNLFNPKAFLKTITVNVTIHKEN